MGTSYLRESFDESLDIGLLCLIIGGRIASLGATNPAAFQIIKISVGRDLGIE